MLLFRHVPECAAIGCEDPFTCYQAVHQHSGGQDRLLIVSKKDKPGPLEKLPDPILTYKGIDEKDIFSRMPVQLTPIIRGTFSYDMDAQSLQKGIFFHSL